MNSTDENCPDSNNQLYFNSITVVSIFLNLILLTLIRTNTPALMKPYIKILYLSVIIDLIACLVQEMIQMVSFFKQNTQ